MTGSQCILTMEQHYGFEIHVDDNFELNSFCGFDFLLSDMNAL